MGSCDASYSVRFVGQLLYAGTGQFIPQNGGGSVTSGDRNTRWTTTPGASSDNRNFDMLKEGGKALIQTF